MSAVDGHISLSVFRIVVFALSISGNSLILFIMLRSGRLRRSAANLLLAQLAFADLFLGIAAGTRGISNIFFFIYGTTTFEKSLCLFLGTPTNFGIHIMQATICAISLDRFLCISFALLYRRLECVSFTLIRFLTCLTFSLAGTFASYIGVSYQDPITICSGGSTFTSAYRAYYLGFTTFFSISVIVFYIAIYTLFRRQNHASFSNSASQRTLFATMTGVLVTFFFCSGLPAVAMCFSQFVFQSRTFSSYLSVYMGVSSTVSSVANVFVYGWKYPVVRNYISKLVDRRQTTVVTLTGARNSRTGAEGGSSPRTPSAHQRIE